MEELILNILNRLENPIKSFTDGDFNYFVIDDLLPYNVAKNIADNFPSEEVLKQRNTLREYKRVGVEFENYNPVMEKITYAFHDDRVVKKIEEITGLRGMIPDKSLYAGGLSSMTKNSFLNPHLDNSHDDDGMNYRLLNLLYYVSEGWKLEYGGNLVLFPKGMKNRFVTIESRFNRLVLMETNHLSFHAVSKVINDAPRRCVSNYYFGKNPPSGNPYRHITSFFAFPEEPKLKQLLFDMDRRIRQKFSQSFKDLINYKTWQKRSNH